MRTENRVIVDSITERNTVNHGQCVYCSIGRKQIGRSLRLDQRQRAATGGRRRDLARRQRYAKPRRMRTARLPIRRTRPTATRRVRSRHQPRRRLFVHDDKLHVRPVSLPAYDTFEYLCACVHGSGMNTLVIDLYRPGTRRRCLNDDLTSDEAATETENRTHIISAFLESFT